jgi:hypothetical protein
MRNSLRRQITLEIERSSAAVFLPREFARLAGEDQVLRALRQLVRQGQLVRLGYGAFAPHGRAHAL